MRHAIPILSLCLVSAAASAQTEHERKGTWEYGFNLIKFGRYSASGPEGTGLRVSGELGWGLAGGYNFTNRFAIQFDYSHASPSYDATFLTDDNGNLVNDGGDGLTTISHTLDLHNVHVKGTFYLLDRGITPFIEVGAGWSVADSNIIDGPPASFCWWDPWWGYVCSNVYDTYERTETSYTAAIGVRWDIYPSIMVRADYGILDIDSDAVADDHDPDTLRMAFGWRF